MRKYITAFLLLLLSSIGIATPNADKNGMVAGIEQNSGYSVVPGGCSTFGVANHITTGYFNKRWDWYQIETKAGVQIEQTKWRKDSDNSQKVSSNDMYYGGRLGLGNSFIFKYGEISFGGYFSIRSDNPDSDTPNPAPVGERISGTKMSYWWAPYGTLKLGWMDTIYIGVSGWDMWDHISFAKGWIGFYPNEAMQVTIGTDWVADGLLGYFGLDVRLNKNFSITGNAGFPIIGHSGFFIMGLAYHF